MSEKFISSNILTQCPWCKNHFWVRKEDIIEGKERDIKEMTNKGELQIGGEEIHAIDRVRIKK